MKIKIKDLEKLVKNSLRTKYDNVEINLITEVIMFGELSGKTSHGIVRLISGASVLSMNPTGKPEIDHITKLSSIIKGIGHPGMLIGPLAANEAISLAKRNSFGIVGTRGSMSSSGSLSYYLEKITKENLIGLIMAQSPESTPPNGGIQPLFGTNPIAFGFPSDSGSLIFDMGTSAISFGAILKARELGKKLPMNVALDKYGNVTDDPNKVMDGATLPFDRSYKGAGLAMMVEIFAGLWPGAGFSTQNKIAGWGNLFMAFSPELLMKKEEFKEKIKLLVETVRKSKTKNGKKVRIAGEKTLNQRDDNLKKGFIDVDEILIKKLKEFSI